MNFLAELMGHFLRWIYEIISTGVEPASISFYAIAIIVTTIIFKTVLLPLNIMQTKNQLKMAEFQPQIQEMQRKYKNDPQLLAQKQQQLYKEANYNPMAGCLPMLIQFPILIAFYRIFQMPTRFAFTDPGFYDAMQKNFFFVKNLDHPDPTALVLPIIAAGLTFLTSYLAQKNKAQESMNNEQTQSTMRTMMIMMPAMIFFFARNMAAGLVLYWIASNFFGIVQQIISNHMINKRAEEKLS
ncbi:YidC/Oxa1 family membrane protein insertase [Peptoniphilus sp. KCTC 25270]|nr:YidC/Oxa1 family membrane protein insertase [Peptoniphilus sp. KCTC 25270]